MEILKLKKSFTAGSGTLILHVIIIMAGTRENFWNELKKYLK